MFAIKDHYEYSAACFKRDDKPENRDLCICADFSLLPGEFGKCSVRIVMDGMSKGNGKEAVELAAPVLIHGLVGNLMNRCCEMARELEDNEGAVWEQEIERTIRNTIFGCLFSSLKEANDTLCKSRYEEPHCTVSIAVIFHRHIFTANMGDSPIYLLDLSGESTELKPLFTCDNVAAEKINEGLLTEESALHSYYQSQVRRFLGCKKVDLLIDREIHFRVTELPCSGVLLLGSDGALSQLTRKEMGEIVSAYLSKGLSAAARELNIRVGETGSRDDFTLTMDWIKAD